MLEKLMNAARKVTGTKQVIRGLKNGSISHVYVADDSDTFIYRSVMNAAEDARVPVTRVASMKELGKACGIDVATAAAAIVK